ncbi:hypothetical protein BDZ91DRAFT_722815 [Kalaharituber pfeilii]|nr:hypothetical protein BDZ91DRAFT_722815 [Kalaharituber pfeilii]
MTACASSSRLLLCALFACRGQLRIMILAPDGLQRCECFIFFSWCPTTATAVPRDTRPTSHTRLQAESNFCFLPPHSSAPILTADGWGRAVHRGQGDSGVSCRRGHS